MNALAFLLIVVVVSAVGSLILWLQHRSPSTLESGIEAFQREMRALAPPDDHGAGSDAPERPDRPERPERPERPDGRR